VIQVGENVPGTVRSIKTRKHAVTTHTPFATSLGGTTPRSVPTAHAGVRHGLRDKVPRGAIRAMKTSSTIRAKGTVLKVPRHSERILTCQHCTLQSVKIFAPHDAQPRGQYFRHGIIRGLRYHAARAVQQGGTRKIVLRVRYVRYRASGTVYGLH